MNIRFGTAMKPRNATFVDILSENYYVYMYGHQGMGESTDTDPRESTYGFCYEKKVLIRAHRTVPDEKSNESHGSESITLLNIIVENK